MLLPGRIWAILIWMTCSNQDHFKSGQFWNKRIAQGTTLSCNKTKWKCSGGSEGWKGRTIYIYIMVQIRSIWKHNTVSSRWHARLDLASFSSQNKGLVVALGANKQAIHDQTSVHIWLCMWEQGVGRIYTYGVDDFLTWMS